MHLGSHVAYSVFGAVFIHNVTYIYCAVVSSVKCVACAKLLVSVVYPRSENHTQHIAVWENMYSSRTLRQVTYVATTVL